MRINNEKDKNLDVIKDVDVFYVDFGNFETVTKDYLMPLSINLAETKVQAVHCTMNAIRPRATWPKASTTCFKEIVYKQSIKASFYEPLGSSDGGEVYPVDLILSESAMNVLDFLPVNDE